ncbi:MAG TPA: hypothetical protein VLA72_05700, partial [Anaerolineales bacterium]|nr:hypothetical protein [Anaerolineales bacterium]
PQKARKAKRDLLPWFPFLLFWCAGYAPSWFLARVSVIKERLLAEESPIKLSNTLLFFIDQEYHSSLLSYQIPFVLFILGIAVDNAFTCM